MSYMPNSKFKFFIYFILKQKYSFLIFLIACILASLSSSVWPLVIGKLVDSLSTYSDDKYMIFNNLSHLFIQAFCFWIMVEVLTRVQGFTSAYIYPTLESNIRMSAFRYVNQHSHAYFSNNFVGSIINKINDLPRSTSLIIDIVFNNFIPLITSIIISASIFYTLKPQLSAILVLWFIIHIFVCLIAGIKAANLSSQHSEARAVLQGKIGDTLNNHLNVKLFTKQDFELTNMYLSQQDEKVKNKAALYFIEKFKLILSLVAFSSLLTLFYLTLTLWQQEWLSLGDMIFIFNASLNILALAWTATIEITYFFRELGVMEQALKIIKDPIEMDYLDEHKELDVPQGKIEFFNVKFKYRHNANSFQQEYLKIEGGQKVGLVGLSGSGKTTFINLLLRLFNIDSGTIMIDGQDIKKVTLESLRQNICLIQQEPMLFNRSIMDNIKYSCLDATDEEVIEAAKKANCHDFILDLENGYDTIVGEKAAKISGGQKQRITIARAILKDAPILIMDEATSALDSYTEKQIQESMKYLSEKKTTIIIAHKLSTLLEMDVILVFSKGNIIEQGTHKELIELGGHYAMLWRMQTAGLLPESIS